MENDTQSNRADKWQKIDEYNNQANIYIYTHEESYQINNTILGGVRWRWFDDHTSLYYYYEMIKA